MTNGRIKIASDVVATIAGTAALEIDGVSSLTASKMISELLAKKSPSKGVTVTIAEDSCVVGISLVVKYGVEIHDVANKVQENVKQAITKMTGLIVTEVNVKIEGIATEKKHKEKEKDVKETVEDGIVL